MLHILRQFLFLLSLKDPARQLAPVTLHILRQFSFIVIKSSAKTPNQTIGSCYVTHLETVLVFPAPHMLRTEGDALTYINIFPERGEGKIHQQMIAVRMCYAFATGVILHPLVQVI